MILNSFQKIVSSLPLFGVKYHVSEFAPGRNQTPVRCWGYSHQTQVQWLLWLIKSTARPPEKQFKGMFDQRESLSEVAALPYISFSSSPTHTCGKKDSVPTEQFKSYRTYIPLFVILISLGSNPLTLCDCN